MDVAGTLACTMQGILQGILQKLFVGTLQHADELYH